MPGLAKDILSDGQITEEEYREAVEEYVTCMNDGGVPVYTVPDGRLFQYGLPGTGDDDADWAKFDAIDAKCRPLTIADVEWLFEELIENPDKIIRPQRQVDCLRRHGLLNEEMPWEEFQDALFAYGDSGMVGKIDFNNPDVMKCVTDPGWAQAAR